MDGRFVVSIKAIFFGDWEFARSWSRSETDITICPTNRGGVRIERNAPGSGIWDSIVTCGHIPRGNLRFSITIRSLQEVIVGLVTARRSDPAESLGRTCLLSVRPIRGKGVYELLSSDLDDAILLWGFGAVTGSLEVNVRIEVLNRPIWNLSTSTTSAQAMTLNCPREPNGIRVTNDNAQARWDVVLQFGPMPTAGTTVRACFRARSIKESEVEVLARDGEGKDLTLSAVVPVFSRWNEYIYEYPTLVGKSSQLNLAIGSITGFTDVSNIRWKAIPRSPWRVHSPSPGRAWLRRCRSKVDAVGVEIRPSSRPGAVFLERAIPVIPGQKLFLEFQARASEPCSVSTGIQDGGGLRIPPHGWCQAKVDRRWSWQSVSIERFGSKDATLIFALHAVSGWVEIAGVDLVDVWDFELDGMMRGKLLRTSCPVHYKISFGGDAGNPLDALLVSPPRPVIRGQHYFVTFQARAKKLREATLGVRQANEPWKNVGLRRLVELTPHWRSISTTFKAASDDPAAAVYFGLGQSVVGTEFRHLAWGPSAPY